MMRIAGWERNFVAAIERHTYMPFEWGESDCAVLTLDVIEAVTGERPYADLITYRTEKGAARRLRKAGFDSLEGALGAILPEIAPSFARRGDIGLIERDGKIAAAVSTASGFAYKTEYGVGYATIPEVKTAFKVGD